MVATPCADPQKDEEGLFKDCQNTTPYEKKQATIKQNKKQQLFNIWHDKIKNFYRKR